jgi:hypothetical protein
VAFLRGPDRGREVAFPLPLGPQVALVRNPPVWKVLLWTNPALVALLTGPSHPWDRTARFDFGKC